MKTVRYILRLTLTLLLITGVTAALLGLVNELTEDKIDTLTREKAEKARALIAKLDESAAAMKL